MKQELHLEIRRELHCDVLVAGGGAAGIAAAVAAARGGASVILAERNGCLGGTATAGLVGPFMTALDPLGEKQVVFGFMEEFIRRMEREGGAIHPLCCKGGDSYSAYRIRGHAGVTPFSSETFKRVAETMCMESGVRLLYHVLLVKSSVDAEGRITTAYFAAKNGIYAISAKVYIDCTGDGDLAALSGVPMTEGDGKGGMQVSSLFFTVDGIDKSRLDAHMAANPDATRPAERYFEREIEAGKQDGSFPCGRHRISLFESVENVWRVNMTQIDRPVDANDPEDVTRAEIECRAQIGPIMAFLKKHVPGCAHIRLLASAEMLGIRESRRIVGEYCLTEDDVLSGRAFPDAVALVGDSIDLHGNARSKYVTATLPCQIPYRCLLPQRVDNLLAAGRCLSATHIAHSAVRVIPPCFAMGQAAGTAAGLAVRDGISPKCVEIQALRELLVKNGVYLG